MTERDRMEISGTVIDSCKGKFKVQVDDSDTVILCTLSGKIRQNSVKILVADKVSVEVSPYDMTQGRIIFRHKS